MRYDLSNLDSRSFELLAADIIEKNLNKRVEIFTVGKDGGIDGRFWIGSKKVGIIQAKHYPNASFSKLEKSLKKEVEKVAKLCPKRYIVITSVKLTPKSKECIKELFSPYIKSHTDIWGFDDIQKFLSKKENFEIVEKYTQIYISSLEILKKVLGKEIRDLLVGYVESRSDFIYEHIKSSSKKFVYTEDFDKAKEKLSKSHVVIVTGEAGIGKTTLSNMLAFEYIKKGYQFCSVKNIQEAEQFLNTATGKKVIFYFDDFLGENFANYVKGEEGSLILLFIKRIKKNKNIRFILNSRTTILNKAVTDLHSFSNGNIRDDEYLLKIENLSEVNKALILYKHMYFSDLGHEYVDRIYRERNYLKIVRHKNFSPRIIEYILDNKRISELGIKEVDYLLHIEKSLNNPRDIWADYFEKINICTQKLVFLITFNGGLISENELKASYLQYIDRNSLSNNEDSSFGHSVRIASNSLVTRFIDNKGNYSFKLFNPSVGDYVINEYFSNGDVEVQKLLISLANIASLKYFESLKFNKIIKDDSFKKIQRKLFEMIYEEKLLEEDFDWLLFVINTSRTQLDKEKVVKVLSAFFRKDVNQVGNYFKSPFSSTYFLLEEYKTELVIDNYDFLWNFINSTLDKDDFQYLFRFMYEREVDDTEMKEFLSEKYADFISKELSDYLDIDYSKYVDVERDGTYSVDDYGIECEIEEALKENFLDGIYTKEFLEETEFNERDVVRELLDYQSQRAVDAYEDEVASLISASDFDTRRGEDIFKDFGGSSEIDEIFKR